MNRQNLLLWTLLLIGNSYIVLAQPQTSFLLKKVQVKGIPSEAFFSSIAQDDDGFLWIGTLSGLYRYDGLNVIRFLRDPSDSNSLTHNFAKTLTKDPKGNIWIGTYGGFMNFYDRYTGRVKRIEPSFKNQERVIVMKTKPALKADHIIAAGPQIIYKISINGRVTDSVFLFKDQTRLTDFLEYETDKFLITAGKLFLLDWKKKDIKPLHLNNAVTNYKCIEANADGSIWLGTKQGILSISPRSFQIISGIDSSVKNVQCLRKDKKGRLWIGTYTGAFVKENNQIHKFISDDSSINPVNVTDIFIDKSESAWITTADNGLYHAYQPSLIFHQIPGMQDYSKKSTILSILEERPGIWLIGTTAGLFRYSFVTTQFEKIQLGSLSDEHPRMSYQFKDRNNGLWLATVSFGLFYKPKGAKEFIWFKYDPSNDNSLPSNYVTALEEDDAGRLWIGTYNSGTKMNSVCYYDPHKKIMKRIKGKTGNPNYLNSSNISQIENAGGNLWIGSWDDGLYRLRLSSNEPAQNTFTNYSESAQGSHKISHDVVSCVRPAKDGRVWFGTVSGGINVLDTKTDSVHWYTIKEGLASNFVYRIEEDDQGILWISTDNGISRFDPATNSFINYDKSEGLPAINFAFLSSAKFSDGTIVFGTNDGQVVYFNTNANKDATNVLRTLITDVRLSNKSITPGYGSLLSKAPYLTDTIELSHNQPVISFDLANMDFINPENYAYAYMLEGFEKNWTYTTDRNSITYTNLDPGTYTLLIKNADHHGIWNKNLTKLVLIVNPPYWETWWFRTLLVIALASGIYWLFRYRLQQKLKIFAVRQRLHRDLHDDVGATLSSVKVYSEILGKDGNNEVIAGLIKENATEMMDRLEVISWATNPEHDNFKSLVDAMLKFARTVAHAHGTEIHFVQKGFTNEMMIPGDVRQNVLLIFKEAINNMLKYAEATQCHVTLLLQNHKLVLQVKDNGKGNDGNIKGGGSGLKNMHKRAEEMNGIIEIETAKEKGALVRLLIPYPFKWAHARHQIKSSDT